MISRLQPEQQSPETGNENLQISMNESSRTETNEATEELCRLNVINRCEECCRKFDPNNENSRLERPVILTVDDDDNPPPYSALIPQNHAAWTYNFSTNNSDVRNAITLEQFQQRMTSSSTETCSDCTRPSSFDANPLTTFWVSKTNPDLSLDNRTPDNLRIAKMTNLPRRYGTILMAGIVVVSLMVLSLIVRFVVERSFWRN